MRLQCLCGETLDDIGAPNDTEHVLLSNRVQEKLQDLVDGEVGTDGIVNGWPEHWENAGAVVLWKCWNCGRLYVNPRGARGDVVVYGIERQGLE